MKLLRVLKIVLVLLLITSLSGPLALAKKKEAKPEPLYPNATREDPEIKQSRRLQKKLMAMYDLSQGEDPVKTAVAAEEVLNSSMAGAYERSLAAQILAFSWIDRDDYVQAIPFLERSLQENGLPNDQHFQIMYQLSQLYLSEENYEKSLEVLDRFLAESRSEKPEHLAMKANSLYRMERFAEAVEAMNKAVAATTEPQNSWMQILMASYFELNKPEEAAKIAEGLMAKNPDDVAMARNLANIYLQAEGDEAAETRMMGKAITILEGLKARGKLTEERDYTQLYQLYHYTEKEAEAIALINEGLGKGILKPGLVVYRALAEANYFSEQIPAAIEAYKLAATFADNGEISLNTARLLIEEERWADAKAAIADALKRGVKRPGDAYVILGAAELGLNQDAAAIQAYKEAAKYPETKSSAESWLRQAGKL